MQAIAVKFLPCTNTRPARMKAWCERGSIVLSYHSEVFQHSNHGMVAARALCEKFAKEDEAKGYGPASENPWMRPLVGGGLPNGCGGASECFVFMEGGR
jgi:hypothetical protein